MASAQIKSALLLAGLTAARRTSVTEPAPTRDHTERMLADFGVSVNRDRPHVRGEGGQSLTPPHRVPGDFSSAAFFLVAGALAAPAGLTIRNIGINPTRTGLLELLRLHGRADRVQRSAPAAGAEPAADLRVRASPLRGIRVPERTVPLAIDEFPVLFVAAAAAAATTS